MNLNFPMVRYILKKPMVVGQKILLRNMLNLKKNSPEPQTALSRPHLHVILYFKPQPRPSLYTKYNINCTWRQYLALYDNAHHLFVCLFFIRGMGMTVPAPNFYYNSYGGAAHLSWQGEGAGGGEFRLRRERKRVEKRSIKKFKGFYKYVYRTQ